MAAHARAILTGGEPAAWSRLGFAVEEDGSAHVGGLRLVGALAVDHVAPRPAVQPGRRIATVRPEAGLPPALALMTPQPPRTAAVGD